MPANPGRPRTTLMVICSTDGAGSRANISKRLRSTMVLSGSRIWSAGHEDDRICFGRSVGSGRDRRLCQRSRHQDLLGAAGTPVLLSIFWLGRVGSCPAADAVGPSLEAPFLVAAGPCQRIHARLERAASAK